MKFFLSLFSFLVLCGLTMAQPSHSVWNDLLGKHVSANGWVSYRGFVEDSTKLNSYLSELSENPPAKEWSENAKLAYWINAYNAFTVKLIIDHYPTASIKDIKNGIPFVNSVWDLKFFKIGGKEMDLNEIEHAILRKQFEEPRIHFAIVCASKSCPKLLNEAYTAERLEQQLEQQTVEFINDTTKNRVSKEKAELSQIFNWFKGDFTRDMKLQEFIAKYALNEMSSGAKISFMDYDWSLNGE